MSWTKFIFTKAFWAGETPVYVSGGVFLASTAVLPGLAMLTESVWFIAVWWALFIAFVASIVWRMP